MNRSVYFENRSVRTPDDIKELYRSYFFGRASAIIFHAVVLLYLAVSLALFMYYLIAFWIINLPAIIFALLAALLLLYRIFSYKKYVRLSCGALDGEEDRELSVIIDGSWLFTDEKREHGVPMSDIRRAHLTRNLIYLTYSAGRIIILARNGFKVGSQENFFSYLRERNIPLSGK